MTNKPEKKKGESVLAYYLRVAEWERLYRAEMQVESRSIDRANLRAKFQHQHAVSKQVELDRRSLHELAVNNPLLRRVLRKLQS